MIQINNTCTGCNSCNEICPKHAINFTANELGFYYPVIDFTLCVDCGLCEKVCHLENDFPNFDYTQNVYAVLNKSFVEQILSSSAGVFTTISKYIIKSGGVVYGAAWDGKYAIKHIRVDRIEDLSLLRRSKYLESNMSGVFSQAKADLLEGLSVLFSGTPCQISALRNYLKKDYQNLITIDVVCHGVPSQEIFKQFIEYEERSSHRNITSVDFRHKIKNKGGYITRINYNRFGKNHSQFEPWFGTSYGYLFMNGYILRDSCYSCKYATFRRVGDITLGDFWNVKDLFPEINDRYGVGLVIVNSLKGQNLFDINSSELEVYKSNISDAVSRNLQLQKPSKEPEKRNMVLKLLLKRNYKEVDKLYHAFLTMENKKQRIRFKATIFVRLFLNTFSLSKN